MGFKIMGMNDPTPQKAMHMAKNLRRLLDNPRIRIHKSTKDSKRLVDRIKNEIKQVMEATQQKISDLKNQDISNADIQKQIAALEQQEAELRATLQKIEDYQLEKLHFQTQKKEGLTPEQKAEYDKLLSEQMAEYDRLLSEQLDDYKQALNKSEEDPKFGADE